MAMSDYSLSDIAAVSEGTNGGGWGNNGDGWWIILLFILLGGWGGNRGGWGNQGGAGSVGGDALYPWMELQQTSANGFASLSNQLCNCCSDMQQTVANGFFGVESAAAARQMADMQQNFALQTAMMQGFNAQQAQLAQCCCDNRLGIANLGADLAREACADRQAVSDGIRDVLANQTANTQRIIDKLCDQELFAERRENDRLRQELSFANLRESQVAQTAQILAGQTAEVDALYNRLNTCPVPTEPVYGRQPIFTCQNNGCGCGYN